MSPKAKKKRPKRSKQRRRSECDFPTWPEKLIGAKYVRLLEKELKQLRKESSHGNRRLFLDDVLIMYLLAFFNPTIRSLRTIEDLSQTAQAQKHLSIRKLCKSTLSDFNKLVDPERLAPMIEALQNQLPQDQKAARELNDLLEKTVAVDGTFLPAVAEVAWAIANSNNHGAVRHRARLDAHVRVQSWLPELLVVPEPGQSESDSAIANLQADRIYVYDRGFTGFALLRAHYELVKDTLQPISHFVVRYKREGSNTPTLMEVVESSLTDEDRKAGVVSDRTGRFDSKNARREGVDQLQLREVVVPYTENGEQKTLRIITNLFDVSAKTIALLYRYRWQVELFFRWFKSFGNFGHLISHSSQGVLSHLYVTIIGVMLMYLHTGHRPSKYLFALVGQVAAGGATLDEILPILRERERRQELDRQSAARRRARKKSENK